MEKNKKLIVLGVLALILTISGITYAILTWTSSRVNIGLTSNCFTIDYIKGNDIANATINLLNEEDLISNNKFTIKEGMALTYANIGIKSTCTIEGYGSLYLNITSLSDAFTTGSSKGSLKYAVLRNTSSVSTISITNLKEQSFDIASTGSINEFGRIKILDAQLSNTAINKYLIVVYIDNSLTGNDVIGATFSGTVSAEAEQGILTTTDNITNLFSKTSTVHAISGVNYDYDTNHNLMKDDAGNIRYYGATPNNYIYFNCHDYEYQSEGNCELWRIIGVFDGKLKLIRERPIVGYSWDNKDTSTGAETDYGKNDWTEARLMKLLNPGYESETVGGSLYYNAKSGNCYAGQNNATRSCNFEDTGILNDTTRNLISDTTYYLGGYGTNQTVPNEIYEKERGTTVYSGRPTTWTGKIALPYPSDYGYAADLVKCNQALSGYSECKSNNWMMPSLGTKDSRWLLTPDPETAYGTWHISSFGGAGVGSKAFAARNFNPVLYLNSELSIKTGTGSSSEPYQLSVN